MDWQPIETAPTDGSSFLAWADDDDFHLAYRFGNSFYSKNAIDEHGYAGLIEPTHWMPLPEPPNV